MQPVFVRTLAVSLMVAGALTGSGSGGVGQAAAEELSVPVLVPVTGFLSLEGTSQRNGALLALKEAPRGVAIRADVTDTGTSPEGAVTALERAMGQGTVVTVAASMLGTQMLAMLPLAAEYKVPLVTVSGTASITEQNNPYVFRFFPGDAVTKRAHARYVVEELKRSRPAIIYQTTAYGQSGRSHLSENFRALGVTPVFEEGVDTAVKDMLPVLTRALDTTPDVLVLHLHAGPTALFVRQAVAKGVRVPLVTGSALHQPSTAALVETIELKGVCAETAASPISGESSEQTAFSVRYRSAYGSDPDAYALGQYDGLRMVLDAVAKGARTSEAVQQALASGTHTGLAMTYKSDGKGNMAHSAVIICYDGQSRIPKIVKRYDNLTGVLP